MTSTSHKSPPTEPETETTNEIKGLLQPLLQLPILERFRFGSIGTRLFVSVMAGALVGMGGVVFLFGEVVKFQAESEIQQTLDDKVNALENTLGQTEILANTFRTSLLTLHNQKAKTPQTYRNLTLELFKNRPDSTIGLGFGQSENGILPEQEWFFSYYKLDSGNPNSAGELLSLANQKIRYIDGTKPEYFYPETDRYRDYFLPQKNVWSAPYVNGNQIQFTYYSQILSSQGNWLGTVFVDLNSASLNNVLEDSVLREAGFFALLTEDGKIISHPSSAPAGSGTELATTYQSIAGLEAVWTRMLGSESGLVEGNNGYWAYERVPGKNWITIAFVPYRAVFGRIALMAVSSTIAMGILLAIVVALTMRYLKYRLRPILNECNRLSTKDTETLTLMQHQDEIGQLSIAFFNLLEQIKINEVQIHQEAARTAQAEAQLQQAEANELEGKALRTELSHLLQVMSAVEAGDLTVAAQMDAALTQEVAESLNRLITRLGQVMAIVLNAADRVTQGAEDLEQLAVKVASNAQQQTRSVVQVQTLMEDSSKLSQETALQAVAANEAVQLAQSAIAQGQQEIVGITGGISALEQDTQQIIKRTQTLTNYVELAMQFAKDQKRIAAMTRILAVNASMLASRASAQQDPEQLAIITREFETIAGQVNTLASQTNQSLLLLQQRTDQIQTVVSGLNHDVQEISQQVNAVTTGVEQSSKAFDAIKAVNDRIAQMGQRVVQSSQTIADATQLALASIQDISTIASTTLQQADNTQEQAQQMKQFAHVLLRNVDSFQLPAGSQKPETQSQNEEQSS